jgi:uncharacterized protein (TIGR03437 family)
VQDATATALALAPGAYEIVAGGGTIYAIYSGAAVVYTANVAGTIYAVAVDSANNVYAAGGTGAKLFQGTPGAFQTAPATVPPYPGSAGNSGAGDAFLAKFDSQLHPVSSTLLGGEAADQAQAIALAANGSVMVGGSTASMAFPTRGAAQNAFSLSTSFLAALTPDLSTLQFSTYEGDARTFSILSIAPMPDGGAVFAGSTASQALVVRVTTATPAGPRIDSVVNAASHLGVALSPGETFAITGAGFGADAAVLVNGTALTPIAKSSTTLIAAVPPDFTSAAAATVTVQSGGAGASIFLPFATAAPGVFSMDGSGVGQGYILNADGSLNSPSNPALEGSKITIYATGVGPMTFVGQYAVTNLPVEILIDGLLAPGIAAVSAPVAGLPGNVYQISVSVPQPYLVAHQNPAYLNVHLPSQSALTLVMNPDSVFSNGILVSTIGTSQAGLGISVSH